MRVKGLFLAGFLAVLPGLAWAKNLYDGVWVKYENLIDSKDEFNEFGLIISNNMLFYGGRVIADAENRSNYIIENYDSSGMGRSLYSLLSGAFDDEYGDFSFDLSMPYTNYISNNIAYRPTIYADIPLIEHWVLIQKSSNVLILSNYWDATTATYIRFYR